MKRPLCKSFFHNVLLFAAYAGVLGWGAFAVSAQVNSAKGPEPLTTAPAPLTKVPQPAHGDIYSAKAPQTKGGYLGEFNSESVIRDKFGR
jgi:hypothetical protein